VYSRAPLEPGVASLLDPTTAEHVVRVLRLRAGAPLTLFDGRGGEFEGEIESIGRSGVRVAVGPHLPVERESPLAVTLLQGISRGERMDLVIQKATELGVRRIVPLEAERSVVRLDADTRGRRVAHWNAVAVSACEQCGRNRLPLIAPPGPLALALAPEADGAVRLILDPLAARGLVSLLGTGTAPVVVLIGPEGGLAEGERAAALAAGFVGCSVGPRILRTETAAIAALAAIQAIAGDLGGTTGRSQEA
jgi:16S rRNA (uracil1498-N3)-methyltransferase